MKLFFKHFLQCMIVTTAIALLPTIFVLIAWLSSIGGFDIIAQLHNPNMVVGNVIFAILGFIMYFIVVNLDAQ